MSAGDESSFNPLSRELEHAELRDSADLHPRFVPLHGLLQRLLHAPPVLILVHVDEVDDDQATEVAQTELPVYLAGGLKSVNVYGAITQVRPFGVDLCTGVRTNDQLDEEKLKSFMEEVRRAAEDLSA